MIISHQIRFYSDIIMVGDQTEDTNSKDLAKNEDYIGLINTSNRTIDFDTGGYSVTLSIHGTAAQHLAANEAEK